MTSYFARLTLWLWLPRELVCSLLPEHQSLLSPSLPLGQQSFLISQGDRQMTEDGILLPKLESCTTSNGTVIQLANCLLR